MIITQLYQKRKNNIPKENEYEDMAPGLFETLSDPHLMLHQILMML